MKRIIFVFLLTLVTACVFGQTAKRTTAFNYLRNGKLDKALENIEPTTVHEKTMNEAKTWFYRGNIYMQIGLSDNPDYRKLSDNPFGLAFESFQKAQSLDGANEFKLDIFQSMGVIAEGLYISGVDKFNAQDYRGSAAMFEKAALVKEEVGVFDTLSYFNVGLCAEFAEDYKWAKSFYDKLYMAGHRKPGFMSSMANISARLGDTTAAFGYAAEGRKLYPDNFQLLITETNLLLAKGITEKALQNLELALTLDQTNPSIFFAVGANYDKLGNFEKAESAYLKAIELNPDLFDAIYNIGALYVNKAAIILEEANRLPLDKEKEYNEAKAQADDYLVKALPFLEKAHLIDPNDRNTMISLKEIYTRESRLDKVKEMNGKLGL